MERLAATAASSSAAAHAATTAHEHLKNVVGIHSTWHTTATTTLVDLIDISSLIVHLTLLRVGQDRVCLANLFELPLCLLLLLFRTGRVLIRVPLDGSFLVRLLYHGLAITFVHPQDEVIILAQTLFQFELGLSVFFA